MLRYAINQQLARSAINAHRALVKKGDQMQTELTETQVYVGLNDSETRRQEHDTDSYVSVMRKVCIKHGIPFSFDVINGGYIHDDGEYTEERTIVLTFFNTPYDTVNTIAEELCSLFHQESVLVTTGLIKTRMVHAPPRD